MDLTLEPVLEYSLSPRMTVPFVVNRASPMPLQRQIYQQWRTAILEGRFRRGERVPSTRAFAETYGVSRVTVTAAYISSWPRVTSRRRQEPGPSSHRNCPTRPFSRFASLPQARVRPRQSGCRSDSTRLGSIRQMPSSSLPLNLSNVSPDVSRFPFALWRRLITRHLREGTSAIFEHRASPAGLPRLREAIAAYLARARAVRCSPDQIIVVSGSQQALDLCARLLLDPGDEVAVEEPGYPGARQLFQAHGAQLRTLPVTDAGPSLNGFARTLGSSTSPRHTSSLSASRCRLHAVSNCSSGPAHMAPSSSRTTTTAVPATAVRRCPRCTDSPTARPSSTSARSRTSCSAAFAWDTSSCRTI